jgi:hypothetical protein
VAAVPDVRDVPGEIPAGQFPQRGGKHERLRPAGNLVDDLRDRVHQ